MIVASPRRFVLAIAVLLAATEFVLGAQPPARVLLLEQLNEACRWAAAQASPGVVLIRNGGGVGSGALISADGYILTNNHVIGAGSKGVTVHIPGDDKKYPIKVVGRGPRDIALIKIEGDKPFPYIRLGDSDTVQVGDLVLAIGAPYYLNGTVTLGTVNATGRGGAAKRIQVDTPTNPGNSGGPVLSLAGAIVGVNGTSNGTFVSFGTPINFVKQIMPDLLMGSKTGRGSIGVEASDEAGAVVKALTKDGPAEKAGLLPGDRIVRFNGYLVADAAELAYIAKWTRPATVAPVHILRKGAPLTLKLAVADSTAPAQPEPPAKDFPPLTAPPPAPQLPPGAAVAGQLGAAWRWAAAQVRPAVVTLDIKNRHVCGVLLHPDGYILTSTRALGDVTEMTVKLPGDKAQSFAGKLLARDWSSDLALVRIDGKELPCARLGSARELQVADWVVAISASKGLPQAVNAGLVSGLARQVTPRDRFEKVLLLQANVPCDPASTGGPLVNLNGEVIGLVSRVLSRREGSTGKGPFTDAAYEGVTLAVPSETIRAVLPTLAAELKVLAPAVPLAPPAAVGVARDISAGLRETLAQVQPAVVTLRSGTKDPACGVLIDEKGHILTCYTALAGATTLKVSVPGRQEPLEGKVVRAEKSLNLALLQVEAAGLPCARLGDASKLRVGDMVLAVGAPFGLEQTVTRGIISMLDRPRTEGPVLQLDAAINPANLGGPIVNMQGEVVGIASANSGAAFRGLAFAVPINIYKERLSR